MTRQRQLIYKIIMNTEGHLSADEIFGYAKAEMPSSPWVRCTATCG